MGVGTLLASVPPCLRCCPIHPDPCRCLCPADYVMSEERPLPAGAHLSLSQPSQAGATQG